MTCLEEMPLRQPLLQRFLTQIPLQRVLLFPLLGLTIFSMVLVGYLSYRNSQEAVNDVARQLRREINTRIEEHLFSFLETAVQINDVNVQAFHRGILDPQHPEELEHYFWEQVQLFSSVTSISFGNNAGGVANAGREGVGGPLYIIRTQDFTQGVFYKYATDAQGERMELLDTISDFDARERSWYREAVEQDTTIWSEIYILFTGQDKCISVSRPAYNAEGELLGVMAVNLFLSHLSDFLAGIAVGKTGESFILEESGLLIASSSGEKPFFTMDGTLSAQRKLAHESENLLTQEAAGALLQEFGAYAAVTQDQPFTFPLQGQQMFGQVTPFQNPYGLDWFIVTVIPELDFLAQIQSNNQVTFFLIFMFILLIITVSLIITRRITHPISQLQLAAGTLARGKWGEINHQSSRIEEINALSCSFHHMSGQLQEMVAGLNQEIAERKQVEEKLKESEERFRSISELALDAVILIDEEGKVVYWSPSAETIFGYSRDAVMGQCVHLLLMPEKYGERYQKGFTDFKKTGQGTVINRVLELTAIHQDGREIPIEIAVSPIIHEKGFWASAIIRDISERKMMEEKIAYQYEFQKIVANLSYSFLNIPRPWFEEAINNALYRMGVFFQAERTYLFQFSASGHEISNTHEWCAEGISPQINKRQNIPVSQLLGVIQDINTKDFLYLHDTEGFFQEEGEKGPSGVIPSRLLIPISRENQVFGFFGMDSSQKKTPWGEEEISLLKVIGEIISNVFARHQVEEELTESETRYRTLVSNIPGVIFRCNYDTHWTMRFISDDIEEITGYPSQDFIHNRVRSFASIIHPEDGARVNEMIRGSFLEKDPYALQYRIRNAHGQTRWVQENGQGMYDREGHILYIDGVILDITEQKEAEQKLDRRTQELEEEMEKAQKIHERILPSTLPYVEGLSWATFYQPAQKLGGDFYDVIQVGELLVIYLSDVSGHGLDGAMLSVFVKHTIRNYLSFSDAESITPSEILQHLMAKFREENYPREYFICIFLGVLNIKSMELTYTGAGFQDTPLLRRESGAEEKLISRGLFISSCFPFELMNFTENSISLSPGTTLFFHTDGLTEQGNSSSFYGERLPRVFYEHAHRPPQIISQQIREDFFSFNQGSLQGDDDITFLILQVDPKVKKTVQLELDTDWEDLKELPQLLLQELADYEEEVNLLLASLNELVANAMEHGNQLHPHRKVWVDLKIMPHYIQVQVEDEGKGFHWQEKIDRPLELEGHSDRGRGIPMIQLFADGLFYNEKGNQATFFVGIKSDRG